MEKRIHGITESSALEKPSKIINSTFTTNPHPQVPQPRVFGTLLGMAIPALCWAGCASA